MAASFAVGSRVADRDGFLGTIRYVGPVVTSKTADATYIGVDWDVAARGKGDGAVTTSAGETVRYFQCAPGRSASFLKPELVVSGRSLLEAMADKYAAPGDVTGGGGAASPAAAGGSITDASGRSIPMMLVGGDKVKSRQELSKLTHVTVSEALVASIAPPGVLGATCGARLQELDLRANLLWRWADVAQLGRELPRLRVLNLAGNRFEPLTAEAAAGAELAGCLPALQVLVATATGLTWPEAERLGRLAPRLIELHIAKNGISELVPAPLSYAPVAPTSPDALPRGAVSVGAPPASSSSPPIVDPSAFPELTTLDLSDNALGDWGHVHALSALPRLSWLLLADNELADVWADAAPPPEGARAPFAALEQLSLVGNPLRSLTSIDALDALPALVSLRLGARDVPSVRAAAAAATSTEGDGGGAAAAATACAGGEPLSPGEARQLLIARLPRITSLNGSEVRPREREDAEKAYARAAAAAFMASRGVPGSPVTEVFGTHSVAELAAASRVAAPPPPSSVAAAAAAAAAPAPVSECVALPAAFKRSGDSGIIRSQRPGDAAAAAEAMASPWVRSPYPLLWVSAAPPPPTYVPVLDPCGFGASDVAAAAALQASLPRFFILAARHDLLAPHAGAAGGPGGATAAAVVSVTLKSMAARSCMADPVAKRLPLSMTVAAAKQLMCRLFKIELAMARLSTRDAASPYPAPLEDDSRTLGYYGVTEGSEIYLEEVNAAEIAREAAEREEQAQASRRAQEQAGEVLRRAQEVAVASDRLAVLAATGTGGSAARAL